MRSLKTLVLGIDGGTWSILSPLVETGHLPNLARMVREGTWGDLRSTIPPLTAPASATFMTGMNPGRHRVLGFTLPTGAKRLVSRRSVRGRAFWEMLSDSGRRVGVMNIPLTYPPDKVNGFLVTGFLTPAGVAHFTTPPELSARLRDYKIDIVVDNEFGKIRDDVVVDPEPFFRELRTVTENRIRVTEELAEEYDPHCLVVFFTESDRFQHYFWNEIDPVSPDYRPESLEARETLRFFQAIDTFLGKAMQAVGEEGHVVVFSDHGFGTHPTKKFHLSKFLIDGGWLAARGGRKDLNPAAVELRRQIPTGIRSALRRWLPQRFRSRAARLASPIRWDATRAYGVTLYLPYVGIRLNVKGRDPEGIVPPEAEQREALAREIREGLLGLRDPETAEPIVRAVLDRSEIYTGPYVEDFPDLIAEVDARYLPSVFFFEPESLVTETRIQAWSGLHRMEGILALWGKGVRRGVRIDGADIADIAPTVLHFSGEPIPGLMDGRVLSEALEPAYLEAEPPRAGADDTGQAQDEQASEENVYTAEQEEILRKRLSDLGYFE